MDKIAKFSDELLLSLKGICMAMKTLRFWIFFTLTFIIFGTLMNLLSSGFAAFSLMGAMGFPACFSVIWDALLGLFGIGKSFSDWLVIFVVAFLQAILIAMIFSVSHAKKLQKKSSVKESEKSTSENIERAGLAAGLAVLGAGCPTCGTALLTPILGAIFAGSSALVGTVSVIITILACVIIIFSLKKVGEDYYVIMISEKYLKKKLEKNSDGKMD